MIFASFSTAKTTYELPLAKQAMILDVQNWVALQVNIQPSQVGVNALDRRMKVPACATAFDVSFPYKKSKKTVRAKCLSPAWSAYIGINLDNDQNAFVYNTVAYEGDSVSRHFVKPIQVSDSIKGLVKSTGFLDGKRLITDVSLGELVRDTHFADTVTVFKLKKDVLKGNPITRDDVSATLKVSSKVSRNSLFPLTLIDHANASRNLRANTILSKNDLNIRHLVLMPTETITRGQKLKPNNVAVVGYFGKLPSDVLYSLEDINQMEAIRALRSNRPIRASDLKPSLMVKKGDTIVLTSGSGPLVITTTMVALEHGQLDQQISLLNPESNEKVRALIAGPGRAVSLQRKIN